MFRPLALLIALTLVSACASRTATSTPINVPTIPPFKQVEPWRKAISAEDAMRIDKMAVVWSDALDTLPRRAERQLGGYGPLLAVDAALDHPTMTPGSYSCRVVRLGQGAGPTRLRAFPSNFCYVTGEADGELSFTKQTGSDLPAGRLYPDGDKRYVFVGAKQLRAGENGTGYGVDEQRDAVGVVERIGSFRWRLAVPRAGGLDVYELTPTPAEQQPD